MNETNGATARAGTSTRARIPDHVVRQEFAAETVVLNLDTGQYHGLNSTAGHMLAVVHEQDTIHAAVDELAAAFDAPKQEIETDLYAFCDDLAARGLLELREEGGP